MPLTTSYEHAVLDHFFGGQALAAPPATLYVGLSTTTIAADGSNITEPGGNYARSSVANNLTNWPAAAARAKANGTEISFGVPTGAWGTVSDVFVADAATGGTVVHFDVLTQARNIGDGDPEVKIAVGAYAVSFVTP